MFMFSGRFVRIAALVFGACCFSALWAGTSTALPFTHDSGEVGAKVAATGRVYPLSWPQNSPKYGPVTWPYYTQGMELLIGIEDEVGYYFENPAVFTQDTSKTSIFTAPAGAAAQESIIYLKAKVKGYNLGIATHVLTYSSSSSNDKSTIEMVYTVINNSTSTIKKMYLGHYFDFQPSNVPAGFNEGSKDKFDVLTKDGSYLIAQNLPALEVYMGVRVNTGSPYAIAFHQYPNFLQMSSSQKYKVMDTGGVTLASGAQNSDSTIVVSQLYEGVKTGGSVKFGVAIMWAGNVDSLKQMSVATYNRHASDASVGSSSVNDSGLTMKNGAPPQPPHPEGGGGCLLKP